MKSSDSWKVRALLGRITAAVALAAAICAMGVAPAVAQGHEDRGGEHENRGRGQRGFERGHGERGHDRGHRYRGGRGYRSYGYVEPVYVAPPVYYAPEPAPGVSIFLPTIHIR